MKLSANTLQKIDAGKVMIPGQELLQLPEKVLQFGTGILLRGLPDYFIDKANRRGIFNGRIVVVKSTSKGDTSAFEEQNGLYTLCIRGLGNGKKIEENMINSSISRVLNASTDWRQILDCAHDPNFQIVISNTTEVGIKLVEGDGITNDPPISYPGKLLAFLYERFKAFKGRKESGLVIIPTELIPDNGKKLESILMELAKLNRLEQPFMEWLAHDNHFCDSLVDRIVTGTPSQQVKDEIENQLGYEDDLLTVCEVYRLWAIEGGEPVKKVLSFAGADEGMIIAPDIALYRELKLRLLNATHIMSCGIAFLADIKLVREAMQDEFMSSYISSLMKEEIGRAIPYEIDPDVVADYSDRVLDRFRNPHINHLWQNITLNYSGKIRLRCVPVLHTFYEKYHKSPGFIALGFAAYIYFMKPAKQDGKQFYGERDGAYYLIEDEQAGKFNTLWQTRPAMDVVHEVLKDVDLWGKDLTNLPGFQNSVSENLKNIMSKGMEHTLKVVHHLNLANNES